MDLTAHFIALGEEKIKIELIYLQLKIEKALKAEFFTKENLLNEAKDLLEDARAEYYSFLNVLQGNRDLAA